VTCGRGFVVTAPRDVDGVDDVSCADVAVVTPAPDALVDFPPPHAASANANTATPILPIPTLARIVYPRRPASRAEARSSRMPLSCRRSCRRDAARR
jgi:hypothetical protein